MARLPQQQPQENSPSPKLGYDCNYRRLDFDPVDTHLVRESSASIHWASSIMSGRLEIGPDENAQ